MTASTFAHARATLFRAFLGDEPQPTAHELGAVTHYLGEQPQFCAALDDLVAIIVQEKPRLTEDQRTRLQAYVLAQLEGRLADNAFADLQRQLDASVSLSEEYALLYETMQAELQGAVPTPPDIPAPDLAFLTELAPARMADTKRRLVAPAWQLPGWSLPLAGLTAGVLLVALLAVTQAGDANRPLLLFALAMLGLACASWLWFGRQRLLASAHYRLSSWLHSLIVLAGVVLLAVLLPMLIPPQHDHVEQTVQAGVERRTTHSNLEFHLQLEAQLPTPLAREEPVHPPVRNGPCIDFVNGLLVGSACPL